ncbi:hypothetical protein DAPPUDRAFT_110891 [Daphnia pulex]|uniref:Dendritic cell-specific transmembrane protein-like domain-containing protein n=1 Tax=Daphnia pulex TaxID=6669 RepID=E9H7H1_DAPPU|nr:hypothetical protein DAPPUDRAFT_110891 [Daphnia pulex]|eukprot:EFX72188.1 hypothetical protein DAPPUDRAFT_110891 [Daphnia pulex]
MTQHWNFFFLLHYRHNIEDRVAGITGGVVAIGISILLALSQSARCIVSLLIPSLGTRLGKSSLLALLASMLLAGPAANLNYNFKQTTQSLICFGEAAFNQTRLASERYTESMRDMSTQVGDSLANYVNLVESVHHSIDSFDDFLKKTSDSFDSTLNDLNLQMNRCRETVTSVNGNCQTKMDSLKKECINLIKGRGVFRRKKRSWLPDIITSVGENVINEVKKIGLDVADHVDKVKLTDVCNLFSSDLCKFTAEICGVIKKVGNRTLSPLSGIPQIIRPLIGELKIGASYTRQLESTLNHTSSFDEVKRNVKSEIGYFLDRLLWTIETLLTYFSLSTLVVVVITSWLYHFRFQHSLIFDNIYINKDIKAYDSSRQSNDPSLFPLQGSAEKKGIDWVLYQVTDILRRNGRTTLLVGVDSEQKFKVEGRGFISSIFRFLFKEFDYQSREMNQIDTMPCLPNPLQLSLEHLIRPAIVMIALGLATFLQPYCLRSRHAIAAYFYPERQKERVTYLYSEMLCRRQALKASMQHRIPGRLDENRNVAETISNGSRLVKTLNWLGCFHRCCLLCGCQGSTNEVLKIFSKVEEYKICNRSPDCPAFYCASCWKHLGHCAVCGKSETN